MASHENPRLPLPPDKWREIAESLQLPPRQERIIELILCNFCDKQIAVAMGIKIPTVRTYLTRIFQRLDVADRMELVLHIVAMSHDIHPHRK